MKIRFFYILLPLFFAGCATQPPAELQLNDSWQAQQTKLEKLTDWSLSGKLGIFTPQERKSVDIYWQQVEQNFHIRLSGPLGITVLDIEKTASDTVIIDGKEYLSRDVEQLIEELSNMVLPITQLQQWIKGNPIDADYQLDDNQQVNSLLGFDRNNGQWLINYNDYRTVEETNLPHKLQLTRGNLRLKFAISRWEIQSTLQSTLQSSTEKKHE